MEGAFALLKRQPSCRRLAHLTWIAAQPDRDRAGSSILPHAHRPCRSFIKDGPQEGCDSTSVRLRAISGLDSSGNNGPGAVISCVSLCDAHRVQTRDVQGRVQCRRRAVWLPGTDSGSRRAPEGSAASSSSACDTNHVRVVRPGGFQHRAGALCQSIIVSQRPPQVLETDA